MESLRSNAKSTGHIRAEEAIRVKANPRNAPLPRALLLVSDEVRLKIEKLFDIAYMIAKLELPFTTFPSLCALEKNKKTRSLFRKHVPNRQILQKLCSCYY